MTHMRVIDLSRRARDRRCPAACGPAFGWPGAVCSCLRSWSLDEAGRLLVNTLKFKSLPFTFTDVAYSHYPGLSAVWIKVFISGVQIRAKDVDNLLGVG